MPGSRRRESALLALPANRKSTSSLTCSHMQITRLYDAYGAYLCSSCGKHPGFGWLYRCTQDSDGFLPEEDFRDVKPRPNKKNPHADHRLYDLSPSIVKGISKEEYSPEQIATLVRQKEDVRAVVLGSVTRPTTSSTTSSGRTSVFTEHLPESTTFSANTSIQLDEELRQAYDWSELQRVWEAGRPSTSFKTVNNSGVVPSNEKALQTLRSISTAPYSSAPCQHLICASCKPTLRERAFQSIDNVVNNPQIPPEWELQNRTLSDTRIVREIGLPKHSRYYEQFALSETDSHSQYEDSAEVFSIAALSPGSTTRHDADEQTSTRSVEDLQARSLSDIYTALEEKAEKSRKWAFLNNMIKEGAERAERYYEKGDPYPGLSSEFGPNN